MAIMALHLISGASVNFEKKMNISKFFAKTWLFLGFSIWSFGVAAQDMPGGPKVNQLNFTAPATKIMEEIHWLHWFMMIICVVIFVGVFGVMFYSIFKHRKSKGAQPASFHESTSVEIIWTVIPLLNKKIRMITTANDVIHAWAVPAFGVKQDAIPGFVRDTWFKADRVGTYRGQCSELCGAQHAFMPIVVKVVSDEEYTQWVAQKKKEMAATADDPSKVYTLAEQMDRGAKVYASNCAACHQANGKGAGAFPALDGSKLVMGPKAANYNILINGKGAMPKWGGVISDGELAAVMTYTRNAWGNKTGDVIQTQEFATARAAK